jgi:RecA-family ATPase
MEKKTDLLALLDYIHPADCSYKEWTEVGMALKQEGYSEHDWDLWSSRDPGRYHAGECARKWKTFSGNASPVTGGTIYQMALEHGWQPARGYELDWDSPIDTDGIIVDQSWLEPQKVPEPKKWHPGQELTTYLQTLFEPGETVGFVTKSWKNEKGKYLPKDRGVYKKTAGELIEALAKAGDAIEDVVGTYSKDGGAWIRFNPLDGNGVKNENVTEFRYALVESDDMDIDRQNALLRELELPIAVLVHSGGKSLHAIVRIDAADYGEYRKRVDFLYEICSKNGMTIDTQNKNPSRLSRMPGCVRGDHEQYIVDTNIGKASWAEWRDWIETVNDNLPDVEGLAGEWENLPELAPALIRDVLREGHKMLISGPSKAGKSYMLIELVIAIAEGRKWLSWDCSQGRVLYVNLELDRASCLHRFKDVYSALGWPAKNLQNIDIWNLRGKTVPMDKLAPKLIRRAQKKNYKAIVIDPIYKVITGDENSADQMARFCNQFDMVCTELGCAVIYCHHHSKGAQGNKKAIDRASGSGVFARDPDAVIDLIELETNDELLKQQENKGVCNVCKVFLDAHWKWQDDLSQDDLLNSKHLEAYCENNLDEWQMKTLRSQIEDEKRRAAAMTAWRIEGTLREFPRFPPVNLWFRYPIHYLDGSGALEDISPEIEKSSRQLMIEARKEKVKKERADMISQIEVAFQGLEEDGIAAVSDIAEEIGVTSDTIKRWFGNGKKSRSDYKKSFSAFVKDEDRKLYLRRRDTRD